MVAVQAGFVVLVVDVVAEEVVVQVAVEGAAVAVAVAQ